jgi:hypothetical protein
MWHIICLCLPGITRSEQQRFFALFGDVVRASGREPSEMDLSLFFLCALAPEEALTGLEERMDLVERSQELLAEPLERILASDDVQALITDHLRMLLAAEHTWLCHAIAQVQHLCAGETGGPGTKPVSSA